MADDAIELTIEPRPRDIGGFSVRRVLPFAKRRMVGPFVFFDHMGPTRFAAGHGIDVRPHPHICLETVTYLFEGEIVHRDSLGFAQPIRPGDVNWMTAGTGIVHSERTAPERRVDGAMLHGIQAWVALPRAREEIPPAFRHYPGRDLPQIERAGARLRLVAGAAYGQQSPVLVQSPLFYVDADLDAGATLAMPEGYDDRAVYVVSGEISFGTRRIGAAQMAVLASDATLRAEAASRLILIGGARLDGERHLWWNFVASDPARIERAKRDWAEGRFARVPGDDEFIPLPT